MIRKKKYLVTPGPTPVPESILTEMAKPIIHHRTPQFQAIMKEVNEGLQYLFQTKNNVYTFAASGTGAMETACINLVGPKEKAIVVRGGKFGERFEEILSAYGSEVINIDVTWGEAVDPAKIKELLDNDADIKAVFTTLCETSTGVETDIKTIASITKNHGAVLVVDAISALGATELKMDEWGVDAVVSGSQKGLMLPPGLAFLALSEKAEKRVDVVDSPRYYFDLRKFRKMYQKNDTPWTPAVTLVIGLREALNMIKEEGLENVVKRHNRLANAAQKAMQGLGLTLFSKSPSNVLTAVNLPPEIDGTVLVKTARDEYGVSIAGGQAELKGKIFRLAHLGYMEDFDLIVGVSAIEMVLKKMGYSFELGSGLKACEEALLAD